MNSGNLMSSKKVEQCTSAVPYELISDESIHTLRGRFSNRIKYEPQFFLFIVLGMMLNMYWQGKVWTEHVSDDSFVNCYAMLV